MRMRLFFAGVLVCLLCLTPAQGEAFILINEILADPPSGLAGDANNDLSGSTTQDEFVELYNSSGGTQNISNWALYDAVGLRHTFAAGTALEPYEICVVFSGGNPDLADTRWFTASTGSLRLNNTGDTLSLYDQTGLLVTQYAYGKEAGENQSITRFPEGTDAAFIQHTSLEGAEGKAFSPGYFINPVEQPEPGPDPKSVPEIPSLLSLISGLAGIFVTRRYRTRNAH